MLKKLRTIVYHVNDLQKAKKWYADTFEIQPYFDEPFYVGFDINGCELGLDPSESGYTHGQHNITYWQVDGLKETFRLLQMRGVAVHQQITDVGEGILTASIADPFGNIIGLIEVPGEN